LLQQTEEAVAILRLHERRRASRPFPRFPISPRTQDPPSNPSSSSTIACSLRLSINKKEIATEYVTYSLFMDALDDDDDDDYSDVLDDECFMF
jgi:hypothetical protein